MAEKVSGQENAGLKNLALEAAADAFSDEIQKRYIICSETDDSDGGNRMGLVRFRRGLKRLAEFHAGICNIIEDTFTDAN